MMRTRNIMLFSAVNLAFSFWYLGVPMHYRKLRIPEWHPMSFRFEGKLNLEGQVTIIWGYDCSNKLRSH